MPNISVIVPVYNTEQYLPRCIDSILAQTFTDFELLLIDDGSKDNSGKICDEYAAKDSRVRVFHKENGGVSSARNLGLDQAQGEWITFVDSDDWVTECAFNIFNQNICTDFIITSHITLKDNQYSEIVITKTDCKIDKEEIYLFIKNNINTNIIKTPWAKFFKRSNILNLRFDKEITCGEDFLFVLKYLRCVESIYLIKNSSYVFRSSFIDFHNKYRQSIENSIYTLDQIFSSYERLNINSNDFECNLFYDYKCLCQKEIYLTPHLWFTDERIRNIYKKIKKKLGIKFRIKYNIMSFKTLSTFVTYVRK